MTEASKPPTWYWIVGGLALVWNLMGAAAYLAQVMMTEEAIAALPDAERALYTDVPAWAVGAFAVAVWAGTLGSVLLLLRKALAMPVFVVSLLGVLVQMTHAFFIADGAAVGTAAMVMSALVVVIAVALVGHAKSSIARDWLA